MDIFVARQPIFLSNKQVTAYELLFRDSTENFMPQEIDGDKATSSVLSNSFMHFGFDTVSSGKKVFINFTGNLLLRQIPTIFPANRTIIEILENVQPTKEVIDECIKLKGKGYEIALDDFAFDYKMQPFVEIADIIKVDFKQSSIESIAHEVKQLSHKVKLLAEKVETWDDFRASINMGFVLFQGNFFSKPEIIKGNEISVAATTLIELVAETNKSEPDLEKIELTISKDVSVSYKLLSLINSAYFKRMVEISSIKQALHYLGLDELRRFISVILMANLSKNTISELAVVSCVRAKFCELITEKAGLELKGVFTVGLFSLIDAMIGETKEKVMKVLPLSAEIKRALVEQKGLLAEILSIVVFFERGDWEKAEKAAEKLKIQTDDIPAVYKKAVEWAEIVRPI